MKHGTAGGYRFYGCRCAPCTKASGVDIVRRRQQRRDARIYVDRRWVAPLPPEQHGTRNAYAEHSCRCKPCTQANTDDARNRAQRKRQQKWDARRASAQQRRNRRAEATQGDRDG